MCDGKTSFEAFLPKLTSLPYFLNHEAPLESIGANLILRFEKPDFCNGQIVESVKGVETVKTLKPFKPLKAWKALKRSHGSMENRAWRAEVGGQKSVGKGQRTDEKGEMMRLRIVRGMKANVADVDRGRLRCDKRTEEEGTAWRP